MSIRSACPVLYYRALYNLCHCTTPEAASGPKGGLTRHLAVSLRSTASSALELSSTWSQPDKAQPGSCHVAIPGVWQRDYAWERTQGSHVGPKSEWLWENGGRHGTVLPWAWRLEEEA